MVPVPVITDIMVPAYGLQVTGGGDGRTTGGEGPGTADIGGTAVKFNLASLTPGSFLGFILLVRCGGCALRYKRRALGV